MAARISPELTAEWREKIQTSMLLNRLNKIGLGDADCTSTQMKAIEILLRKTLPDLSDVDVKADVGGGLTLTVVTGVPRAGS